jgi:hypothetical protein
MQALRRRAPLKIGRASVYRVLVNPSTGAPPATGTDGYDDAGGTARMTLLRDNLDENGGNRTRPVGMRALMTWCTEQSRSCALLSTRVGSLGNEGVGTVRSPGRWSTLTITRCRHWLHWTSSERTPLARIFARSIGSMGSLRQRGVIVVGFEAALARRRRRCGIEHEYDRPGKAALPRP